MKNETMKELGISKKREPMLLSDFERIMSGRPVYEIEEAMKKFYLIDDYNMRGVGDYSMSMVC